MRLAAVMAAHMHAALLLLLQIGSKARATTFV